jgi:hypothetical protein
MPVFGADQASDAPESIKYGGFGGCICGGETLILESLRLTFLLEQNLTMEMIDLDLERVANVIQIAVTPVFMLVGISGFLAVLIARHGRTVDRSRALQKIQAMSSDQESLGSIRMEQARLTRRMSLSHFAISMATFSAIIVCMVVATLFIGNLFALKVALLVSALFIFCMILLSLAFSAFLSEVLVCTYTMQSALQHPDTFPAIFEVSRATKKKTVLENRDGFI